MTFRKMRMNILHLSVAVLLGGTLCFGQDPRGTILGRVVDPSGAVVPGAVLRVVNVSTGVTITAETNESGRFVLPYLLPGTYTLSVQRTGFKRFLRDGIEVRINDSVEVNVSMQVGDIAESVEVTAVTPLLGTAEASLGQVVDTRRVVELPLLAGNAMELALLTPGVSNTTNLRLRKPGWTESIAQISTDGAASQKNEFQIDGVSNTFAQGGGKYRIAFSPPTSAIREFKIQTAIYNASVGNTLGSVINVSTASGSNELHGEAHYWAANAAFNAPNFFMNKNNQKPPPYQDHRYGASAGAPVFLPGLYNGRNRTFWFYAWEANSWGVPRGFTSTVPTGGQRQGDFANLLKLGGQYQIYNPYSTVPASGGRFQRQPFPNNVIPVALLDAVGLKLASLYPLPNQAGTADGQNNFFYPEKSLDDYFVHLARLDQAFSQNHRLFLRLHYDWWQEDKNHHFGLGGVNGIVYKRINRGLALDDVIVMSPRSVFNVRYGITSHYFPLYRTTRGFDLTSLGFSSRLISLLPDKKLAPVPRIGAGAYSRISPWEATGDGVNTSLTHSLSGSFTLLKGDHDLRFGADFRLYRMFGNIFPIAVVPDFVFPNTYTRGPLDNSPAAPIGQELASMLLGVPGGSMERNASWAMQNPYLGFYLQDDYAITRKLTFNLGLRYELERPITERFDRLVAGFAFGQSNPIEPQARAAYAPSPIPELPADRFRVLGGLTFLGQGGLGRSPFRGEKNNFLPRVGLAYRVFGNTILRAGYGIFYDSIGVNATAPISTGFSQLTPIQASLDNGLTYVATNADPFPNGLLAPLGPAGGLTTNLGQAISFYASQQKHGYGQRWSFGIQHLLPSDLLLEVSYVGSRGTRLGALAELNATPGSYLSTKTERDQQTIDFLTRQFASPFYGINAVYGAQISRADLLRPYPEFGGISVQQPVGYSWYHSLQVRSERRLSKGFSLQLAYTWSKAMEATEFLNPTDAGPYEVVSPIDRTHRLAISGIWEIPVGRSRRFGSQLPAPVDFIVGGWQITGVAAHQSGPPLNFGNVIFNGDLKNVPLPRGPQSADRWFNVDAGFNRNSREQLANNIRRFPLRFSGIRADGQARWDFSTIKNFRVTEKVTLQFRAEVFNAWNHANFDGPNVTPTSSLFGAIPSATSDPRMWQFSLRLKW